MPLINTELTFKCSMCYLQMLTPAGELELCQRAELPSNQFSNRDAGLLDPRFLFTRTLRAKELGAQFSTGANWTLPAMDSIRWN